MRILFVNQFFWPDSAPTGRLLEDVARELVNRGWDVTVVCDGSSYVASERIAPPPVTIFRMPGLPYSRSAPGRIVSWLTFLVWALIRSLFLARFDVVVTLTSPPFLGLIGCFHKALRGSKFWSWEMDVYPDVVVGVGVVKETSLGIRFIQYLMSRQRRTADGVIVLGECMKSRILSHGLMTERVHVAENWSDGRLATPQPFPPAEPLSILYSGNLGLAHDTETIAQAMLQLRSEQTYKFQFVGSGARRASIEDHCKRNILNNVSFLPYAEEHRIGENLAACHIGLVTLRKKCLGTVVPSKVYTLLAAGRPFLFIGPDESTPAELARKFGCGWHVEPGDVDGAVTLLRQLAANQDLVRDAGAKARVLFETKYDLHHGPARVVDLLVSKEIGTDAKPNEQIPERNFAAAAGGSN